LLILLALAALFLLYPYSLRFKNKVGFLSDSNRIDTRYMSEVNGIDTPEDMRRQYKRHPKAYKYTLDNGLAVMYAYPDPNIRWTGMVFVHHFPTVSEVVLDYDGNVIHEHISSPEVQASIEGLLEDNSFVEGIQNQMSEIWELTDPGSAVLDLIMSLGSAGLQVEFLGGRPQTLFDASMFLIRANNQDILVYEFTDEAARINVSENLSLDGYEHTQQEGEMTKVIHIEYLDQPNFWVKENILVQYLGQDQSIIDNISSVLGDPITD
jgi:hypothetical protein